MREPIQRLHRFPHRPPSRACYVDGCRCPDCTGHERAYSRRRVVYCFIHHRKLHECAPSCRQTMAVRAELVHGLEEIRRRAATIKLELAEASAGTPAVAP